MLRLVNIVKKVLNEVDDKTILTSNPDPQQIQKFHETTHRVMKILKNSKIIEKEIFFNRDNNSGDNMFTPNIVDKGNVVQHIGEYVGEDFKNFTLKLAQMYEKAGFKVERGYGIDDIKGFEILSDDEVIGEIDFLIKDSLPKIGDTIIIKHKKI